MAAAEGGGGRGGASPSRHRECRGSGKGRGAVTSTPAAVPAGAPEVAAPNDRRRDKRKTKGAPLQRPGAKPQPHPNERARPRPPHHGVEKPAGTGRRTRTPVPVRKKGGLNHLAQQCGWKEPTADGRQGDTPTKDRRPPHKKNQTAQPIDRVTSEEQKRGEKGNWRRRRHVTKRSLGLPARENTHARRGQGQRRCDGGAATIQTPSTADREGRGRAQEAEAAAERETGGGRHGEDGPGCHHTAHRVRERGGGTGGSCVATPQAPAAHSSSHPPPHPHPTHAVVMPHGRPPLGTDCPRDGICTRKYPGRVQASFYLHAYRSTPSKFFQSPERHCNEPRGALTAPARTRACVEMFKLLKQGAQRPPPPRAARGRVRRTRTRKTRTPPLPPPPALPPPSPSPPSPLPPPPLQSPHTRGALHPLHHRPARVGLADGTTPARRAVHPVSPDRKRGGGSARAAVRVRFFGARSRRCRCCRRPWPRPPPQTRSPRLPAASSTVGALPPPLPWWPVAQLSPSAWRLGVAGFPHTCAWACHLN